MALVEIRRFSDACQKRVGLNVLLPDVGEPPYPTLYLLHGLTDDYTGWLRKSRLEYYLREIPLIVVMPDGYRGWFTRNPGGVDYAHYLAYETVGYVDRFFPTSGERAIGGLSMGGYGALLAALSNPGRFCCAASHSGALIPWERDPAILTPQEMTSVFGSNPAGGEHDLLAQAARHGAPPLWLDCGLEDAAWLDINRRVRDGLRRLGLKPYYQELPGGHDWDYWDRQGRAALDFYGLHLGLRCSSGSNRT